MEYQSIYLLAREAEADTVAVHRTTIASTESRTRNLPFKTLVTPLNKLCQSYFWLHSKKFCLSDYYKPLPIM